MALTILCVSFTLLLLLGVPVAFSIGLSSLATILYEGLPLAVGFQQMISGMNPFSFLAIPFFIFAGEIMMYGGIADRMVPACAGCHSPNGAGIPAQYPRLSGQHADYTVKQLQSFRDGVRKNSPQMKDVAAKMNDREIKAVADYIAGLR